MSTVEAAASLFGPSDSGSEFFTAPESADSASQSPAGDSKKNELFSEQDTSNLFPNSSSEAEASSLFSDDVGGYQEGVGAVGETQSLSLPWEEQSSHTQTGTDGNGQDGYFGGEYYNDYNVGNETQWHGHVDQQTTEDANTGHYDSYASSNDQYGHALNDGSNSTYPYEQPSDLYVTPANINGSQYNYGSEYAPSPALQQPHYDYSTTNSSTSVYDPYNPSNQTSQPSHSMSAPAAGINGTYDPYTPSPSQRAVHPATTPSTFPSSLSSTYPGGLPPITTPSSTVEAPKPPVPPFRPARYDAYDPPLPASKPKRSSTTHNYLQSPVSQHSAPPPPRPPPLRASTFTPDAGNGLLSPPPSSSRATTASHQSPSPSNLQRTVLAADTQSFEYEAVSSQYAPQLARSHGQPYTPLAPPDAHGLPPSSGAGAYSPEFSKESTGYVPTSPATGFSQLRASTAYIDGSNGRTDFPMRSGAHETDDLGHEASEPSSSAQVYDGFRSQTSRVDNLSHKEDSSSRPGSPLRTSTSPPRRSLDSPPIQRSPDKQKAVNSIQRGFSPVSDAGRSWSGSQGRSSRPSSRQGSLSTAQTFSSLDEQVAKHGEPYSFVPRNIGRVNSPDRKYTVGSAAGPSSAPPSAYLSHQDQNVVDLGSDTSSLNGRSSSPALSNSQYQDHHNAPTFSSVYDPYKPQQMGGQRTISPAPKEQQRTHLSSTQSTYYKNSYDPPVARERSMSNISTGSALSSRSRNPYAPQGSNHYDVYGNENSFDSQASLGYQATHVQPVTMGITSLEKPYSPPPVTGPYAPSPSLLGTNDPLGRTGVKVPVINFGFGGKLISCFHSSPALDTGFDVALSSRICTDIHIRPLHKIMPEAALETSTAEYPGPLFGDPGSPVHALVRTTTTSSAKSKSKKTKVLTYLDERAEELQRAIGYLSAGTVERKQADGKLVLVRLLRVLVEFDGQIHGSSEVESAVQSALIPQLVPSSSGSSIMSTAPTGAALASSSFSSASSNEPPIAEYTVRRSALNMIQEFLYRGEKRKAYHYALDEKMWAHAMVIAGSIDKEAFKEVVNEFVKAELGTKNGTVQFSGRPQPLVMNGYESLRLAYSLYSGQSSAAVQNLFSTSLPLMNGPALTLQPPTPMSHMTPLTPNFPSPDLAANVPPEALNKWQEYAAMLYSGQMGPESSAALTTLGDYLRKNGSIEAAHCCYLLSPQSSPIGGVGMPTVRIVLVGSQSPLDDPTCCKDPDSFIFSEIVEFALGLHVPSKGQEPFAGFPHLQAYRLVHALHMAEKGHVALAKRYCDAISASGSKPSPYLSLLFAEKLKEFTNQIIGDPELDRSKAWIGGKIAKPSLDGLGDWIGGTLSRFVEGDASKQTEDVAPNNPVYAGAFSQYSNISSTNTSKSPSPAPSLVNGGTMTQGPPIISSSATGIMNLTNAFNPVNRASSAWDYSRPESRKNTPPPRVASAGAATTTFAQSQSFTQAMDRYNGGFNNSETTNGVHPDQPKEQPSGGWWEQSSTYGSSAATPTVSSFIRTEEPMTPSTDGFVSLMGSVPSFAPSTANSYTATSNRPADDDFDDDLGLGNSSSKRKQQDSQEDRKDASGKSEEPKEQPKKPDPKPQASSSGSWFGRLFSRTPSSSSSSPGPVKANLGEDNAFYFDKELGKWVNKKGGAEPPKPAAPPPPPSRAQTASPSKVFSNVPSSHAPPSPMPPPRRPASAMESAMAPPKRSVTTPRIHSNLIPEDVSSAPPTPAIISSMSAMPPTGRSKSAAIKRNVRSRYVDVIQAQQQENS